MSEMKPGWLTRELDRNAIEVATWPASMRTAGGFTDAELTPTQRRKAAAILRARAEELDPQQPTDREVMQATADRVGTWPAWKRGEESTREDRRQDDDRCLCGGVGCNRCEPRGVY